MESQQTTFEPLPASDLFGELRPLVKGDVVQRGDIFIDDGQHHEMDKYGVCLGVQCLGRTIIKNNGGWHRPSPNVKAEAPQVASSR